MRRIYADNAATTAIDDRVLDAMLPYLKEQYGNPSSYHFIGREAKRAIENSRKEILSHFGEGDIYFTSGGSESNNWALRTASTLMKKSGKNHIITSAFEHHSVLNCCKELEKEGFSFSYIKPDKKGIISPGSVENSIRDDTGLVSIMYVNNEIGTLQPIPQIAEICRNKGAIFHTDAVQAVGKVDIDVENIDLLTFSAHKFHGPKGMGALYARKGLKLPSFIVGGRQEYGKRAGTENVPAIVGMAEALKICEQSEKINHLHRKLADSLLRIDGAHLNGTPEPATGIINLRFDGVDSEALMLMLDLKGICISAGAACTTGTQEPSHVLKALGLSDTEAKSSLRFSIGRFNSEEDIDIMISTVKTTVDQLRKM